ncbi:MAG TPA: Smr/MutS family protein [Pyrinomonadaceae bacterium]|nr:Smr/MutS family protein [Pyrinomonadaceae bacterium]
MPLSDWLKSLFAPRPRAADEDNALDVSADADESLFDPDNPFGEPVRLEITDVFDLHTIAPRDVERVVVEYLEEARRAGFRSVRIIHGKGRGVQRRLVHHVLARTPFIRDWADAPPQSGGWGATVAHLTPQDTKINDERRTRNDEGEDRSQKTGVRRGT